MIALLYVALASSKAFFVALTLTIGAAPLGSVTGVLPY